MGKVIDLNSYKRCKLKEINPSLKARNYFFTEFPQNLKGKVLSLGELMFSQDQLHEIIHLIEKESCSSNPSDDYLLFLEDQKDLYYRAILKSQKVIPLK